MIQTPHLTLDIFKNHREIRGKSGGHEVYFGPSIAILGVIKLRYSVTGFDGIGSMETWDLNRTTENGGCLL
ncbi:hypothetical protein BVY04_00015 [bacterium M21]|nr:hypothetical protein BVY04_00015 [bacterium M21]